MQCMSVLVHMQERQMSWDTKPPLQLHWDPTRARGPTMSQSSSMVEPHVNRKQAFQMEAGRFTKDLGAWVR